MAYAEGNPKTKKQLKEWIAEGRKISVFQPNDHITGAIVPTNGIVFLEGPHYPQVHKWYAKGTIKDGNLVKIT